MRTYAEIHVRVFTVGLRDERTGKEQVDAVALTCYNGGQNVSKLIDNITDWNRPGPDRKGTKIY